MKRLIPDMRLFLGRLGGVLSRRDLVPKLVSLLLAVILWAYIGSTKLAEVDYRIPVELKNAPAGLVVSKQNLTSITLHMNGRKEDVANFNIKNVKAVVNLEGAREGMNIRFPITLVKQEIPESIRLNLSRKYVTLDLGKRLVRRVPVEPVLGENIREGMVAGQPVARPEYVTISGEEAAVKRVDSVKTEPLPAGAEAGKFDREVSIDRSDLRGIDTAPQTVRVQYSLYEMENLRRFEVPVGGRNLREGYRFEAARKKVKVYVKTPGRDTVLVAEDCEAHVDFTKLNATLADGQGEVTTHLKVGASIKAGRDGAVVMVVPSLIQVRVVKN